MPDRESELCGQVLDSRFRIECRLGNGGMGQVWKAQHVHTRQHVALKTPHLEADRNGLAFKRLLQEARIAAAVASPNVVQIFDVNPDYVHQGQPLPFMAMELVDGPSLAGVLEIRERILPRELLWILEQVCSGLSKAHAQGIVHRDLKPSNVLISMDRDRGAVAKLCDFGIAKLLAEASPDEGSIQLLSTETGTLLGTPQYMAPEQLERSGRTVSATDQWAVALIAYRCLTGDGYFDSVRNGAEMVLAIVHDPLEPPSSKSPLVNADFDEWFLRSCARDPDSRYPDVSYQARALRDALGNPGTEPIALRSDTPVQLMSSPSSTGRLYGQALSSARKASPIAGLGRYFAPAVASSALLAIVATNWLSLAVQQSGTVQRAAPSNDGRTPLVANTPQPTPVSVGSVGSTFPETARPMSTSSLTASTDRPPSGPKLSKRVAQRPAISGQKLHQIESKQDLPLGTPCVRSSQCRSGVCLADVCQ